MSGKEREQCWSEALDKENMNRLFSRYIFASDFKSIEEFAIIYLAEINGVTFEIVKYDCSKIEKLNVHYFFCTLLKKNIWIKRKALTLCMSLWKLSAKIGRDTGQDLLRIKIYLYNIVGYITLA
ncbi:MAG: hypothetical protein AABW72_04710 [archaeon]